MDFQGDQQVYAAYLRAYRAGYDAGLRLGARDVLLSATRPITAIQRADLTGWDEGNAAGIRQAERNAARGQPGAAREPGPASSIR